MIVEMYRVVSPLVPLNYRTKRMTIIMPMLKMIFFRRSSQRATGRTAKRSKCCSNLLLQRCNKNISRNISIKIRKYRMRCYKNLSRNIKQEISENIGKDVTTNLCPGISSSSRRNTENIKNKKSKRISGKLKLSRLSVFMEDVFIYLDQ